MVLLVSPNSLAGPEPLTDPAGVALAGFPQMALSVSPNSLTGLGGSGGLDGGLGQPMAGLLGDLAGVTVAGMAVAGTTGYSHDSYISFSCLISA